MEFAVPRASFQGARRTTNFLKCWKFVVRRTAGRDEVEPAGCWERAGAKRQHSPGTLEEVGR
eukprot:15454073-Alexandrium_andersonii.AAC.1